MFRLLAAIALAIAVTLPTQWASAALNLNTATKEELIDLPGIGPAKAKAILDYRTANGGFKSVEELKDVKGIGAKRFEKLKADLTVAPPAKTAAGTGKGDGKSDAKADARGEARPGPSAKGDIKPVAEAKARK